MIRLEECKFKNIFTFGNVQQTVNFKSGVYKIVGHNRDKGGSNGAGKTSIMNIICYAIYGQAFENDIEDIQNYTNNSKQTPAEVILYFSKNSTQFKIVRTKAGSSNGVELWMKQDGEFQNITLGKGVQATNKEIVEIIGLDFDLFCLSHIFSGNVVPFLKRSATDQRKIVECLFDASELSLYAESAKLKKSQLEAELKVEEALRDAAQNLAAKTRTKIENTILEMEFWDKQHKQKLEKLAALKNVNYDFEAELEKFNLLNELKSIKAQEVTPQLNATTDEITRNKRDQSNITNQINHLQDGNCPFCKQSFSSPEKIKELQNEINEIDKKLSELNTAKDELRLLFDDLTEQINQVAESLIFKSVQELNQTKLQIENAETLRISLENAQNPHISTLQSLQQIEAEHKEFDMSKLDALKIELEHVKLLIQLLTNRDSIIRTSIISSQTALLNSRIQHHSKILDLPQILHFDANMKCSVMEFGRSTSYGNLSAGEKRRANLALSYAFRDLVMIKHGGINILMMDEIDGGSLDQQACISIVNSLYEVCSNDTILVITHNELVSQRIKDQITVTKECGFSTIS